MKEGKNLEPESNFQEALRYYKNAKDILRKAKVKDGAYLDRKQVQKSCGIAYLAVLNALDGYLLQYGIKPQKLPKSYDEYTQALKKVALKDGKLKTMFNKAYFGIHIGGYYRAVQDVEMIKIAFSYAKWIIEHLTGKKL